VLTSVCLLCACVCAFVQVVRSIDTLVIVIIPMLVIFVLNAAIGVKICRYTGRTADHPPSPSVAVVAAAAAAARHLDIASHSVDDIYSNCSTAHQMRTIRPDAGGAHADAAISSKRQQLCVSGVEADRLNNLLRMRSACGGGATSPGGGHSTAVTSPASGSSAATSWRVLTRRHQTQLRITNALLVGYAHPAYILSQSTDVFI